MSEERDNEWPPADLECDHCGDVAIHSETGMFLETVGDPVPCMTCGFPGGVAVEDYGDEEPTGWWRTVDDDQATCKREDCADCNEVRAARKEADRD